MNDYFDSKGNGEEHDSRQLDDLRAEDLYEDDEEAMQDAEMDAPDKHAPEVMEALDSKLREFARSRRDSGRKGSYTETSAHIDLESIQLQYPEERPFEEVVESDPNRVDPFRYIRTKFPNIEELVSSSGSVSLMVDVEADTQTTTTTSSSTITDPMLMPKLSGDEAALRTLRRHRQRFQYSNIATFQCFAEPLNLLASTAVSGAASTTTTRSAVGATAQRRAMLKAKQLVRPLSDWRKHLGSNGCTLLHETPYVYQEHTMFLYGKVHDEIFVVVALSREPEPEQQQDTEKTLHRWRNYCFLNATRNPSNNELTS